MLFPRSSSERLVGFPFVPDLSPNESWAGGPPNPLIRLRGRWGCHISPLFELIKLINLEEKCKNELLEFHILFNKLRNLVSSDLNLKLVRF